MTWWTRGPIDVPDQAQKSEVLLVDAKGRPLVVRVARRMGYRPPTVDEAPPAPDRPDKDEELIPHG